MAEATIANNVMAASEPTREVLDYVVYASPRNGAEQEMEKHGTQESAHAAARYFSDTYHSRVRVVKRWQVTTIEEEEVLNLI